MADFFSILSRAIHNMPSLSRAARHAIYDRATKAMVTELRSNHIEEWEIARQKRNLDEAIARIETGFPDALPRTNPSPGANDEPFVLDEAAIKIETGRCAALLRSDARYVETQATLEKVRSLAELMRSIIGFSRGAGHTPEISSLSESIEAAIVGCEEMLEMRDSETHASYEEELDRTLRSSLTDSDRNNIINIITEELIAARVDTIGVVYETLNANYRNNFFALIDMLLCSASGPFADYEAITHTIRLLDGFIMDGEPAAPNAKGGVISDEQTLSAISAAVDRLEKRFGAQAVEEVLRRRKGGKGGGAKTAPVPKPRPPTVDETAEIIAHAQAHPWRRVRRNVKPAARRFLRATYARWLDSGIDIPAPILRRADADLYRALYADSDATGLSYDAAAAQPPEEEAVQGKAVQPPPGDPPPLAPLAIRTKQLQAALAADRAFPLPKAAPKAKDAAGEPPLPSGDEF